MLFMFEVHEAIHARMHTVTAHPAAKIDGHAREKRG